MNDPNVISFFERFGYNIKDALTPGLGPEVNVDLKLENHGYSYGSKIILGNSCFTDSKHEVQSIASTISHELGHIAAESYYMYNNSGSVDLSSLKVPHYSNIDNSNDERRHPEGYAAEWVWWGYHWYNNSPMNMK